MKQKLTDKNKAIVLEAFDTLFNKRDYDAAERFWSPDYIQHSAYIAPGREGLFNLIKGLPTSLRHQPGAIAAEGDYVILHGRFSGTGLPSNWIAADIILLKDGILGTLGCDSGRSDTRTIEEWKADVRNKFSTARI